MKKSLSIKLSGRVRGVGFRYYAVRKANTLGIFGYVKNTEEGVEIMAEGEETALKDFLELMKKGPLTARVKRCIEDWQEYKGYYSDFWVR